MNMYLTALGFDHFIIIIFEILFDCVRVVHFDYKTLSEHVSDCVRVLPSD